MNDKENVDEVLTEDFLDELFKCSMIKAQFLQTMMSVLKLNYLPNENYKKIWKEIVAQYKIENKPPSFGQLMEQFKKDITSLKIVGKIKRVVTPDYDSIIISLEDYIKRSKFVELYDKVGDLYLEGKRNEAYNLFAKGSEDLTKFNLRKAKLTRVFGDYNKRNLSRMADSATKFRKKIPFGIPMLDHYTRGGGETGETTLLLGDSGIGKSQFLIHCGISAARSGFKVLHIQDEGTEDQCTARYDAAWTGTLYYDMKAGNSNLSTVKAKEIVSSLGRGEIFVETNEKFGSRTMIEMRKTLIDVIKNSGCDLLIHDYFELRDPGDGKNYDPSEERFRQSILGQMTKNIAVEFNIHYLTVTQASSIDPKDLNDPNFVITRYYLSEAKGKIRPFDNFITINQTRDEKKNGTVRLYIDKLREGASGQIIPIAQNLERARFYDRKRTIDAFVEEGTEEEEIYSSFTE